MDCGIIGLDESWDDVAEVGARKAQQGNKEDNTLVTESEVAKGSGTKQGEDKGIEESRRRKRSNSAEVKSRRKRRPY